MQDKIKAMREFNKRMSTPPSTGKPRTKNELKQHLMDIREAKKELEVEKEESE